MGTGRRTTAARAGEFCARRLGKSIRAFAAGGLWLALHAHAAEPARFSQTSALPLRFDDLLTPSRVLSSAPSPDNAGLTLMRKLEDDDLEITGFVASRNARDATDYRLYLGLGYQGELGSLAKVTSRAFYGTGTYDGVNPSGGAVPDEVRTSGSLRGDWVGADWKVESRLSARHTFGAHVAYRQRIGFDVLDLQKLTGGPGNADSAHAERKVDIVTHNNVALSDDLALRLRMRYDQDTSAAVEPRVEIIYRPERDSTLSATFDQAANAPVARRRAYTPWASTSDESDRIRNYQLAYERAVSLRNHLRLSAYRYDVDGLPAQGADPGGDTAETRLDTTGFEVGVERKGPGGTRARVSYAWQETLDAFAAGNGSFGQQLTKLSLDVPVLPNRLSTSFELQHLAVVNSVDGEQDRDYLIGNLTLASGSVSSDTRVSLGMHNLFGARGAGNGARLLSFIPPDGRSVRLDVKHKL